MIKMAVQQTLVIVKPDGIAKGLIGQILRSISSNKLIVIDHVYAHLNRKLAEELYKEEKSEVYFHEVVSWISSDKIFLLKIQGEEAVEKIKWHIIGRYPNGIRGRYAENWIKNVAHAPDSETSAKRELELFESIFKRKEKMDHNLFKGKKIFALTGMSECGKSTVGKYLDSQGVPRLKIVKFFEQIRDKQCPSEELYQFIKREEQKNQYDLWDAFIEELMDEMNTRKASMASIESLYGGGLGPYLKKRLGSHFCIVYIDIPVEIRLKRQMQRENLLTTEEAKNILLPRDEIKINSGITALKEIAEEVIDNSGTLHNLYRLVDEMIQRHSV